MTLAPSYPSVRVLRALLRGVLLVWAAFWAWFVLAESLGETPMPPWWIPAAWLAGLAALVALAWRWPRAGGLALVAAATASAFVFPDPGAWALLSAPALVLGLASCGLGRVGRRAGGAALAMLAVLTGVLGGCRAPQDPADGAFRTGSILRHENGRMQRAYLLEATDLAGFPCRGWVWWHEHGGLDNFELARDLEVQGHSFAARTRVFLDREGRLAHAWLSRDARIDGMPCRGGWKIDTAFHENGRLEAFFPPDTLDIGGIPCAASVFAPVYLHPDGSLRGCRLAADASIGGVTRRRGETVELPPPPAGR
jgi:hypothetical protein